MQFIVHQIYSQRQSQQPLEVWNAYRKLSPLIVVGNPTSKPLVHEVIKFCADHAHIHIEQLVEIESK